MHGGGAAFDTARAITALERAGGSEGVDDGIELYVDCKGVIPPPMGATFRRILREELQRAGVTNAT